MKRSVELLPDEYLARPVYRKRIGQWVMITIALSGIACLFGYFQPRDVARLKQETVLLQQSVYELQGMGDRFALLAEELEIAAARQEVVNGLQKTSEWSDLLRDLSDLTQGDLWFIEVNISEIDDDRDGGAARRSRIQIKGVAPSNVEINQFMRRLSASKHLRELQLESSHESQSPDGNVKVEFGIGGIAL